VRIGCGLSTVLDPRLAAIEAGQEAHAALGGSRPDVVCVFASGAHLGAPEAMLEGVHEALAPPVLVGCGAGGVLGDGREVERGTAVAVWAATLGDGRADAFHLEVTQGLDAVAVGGLPELDDATAIVLLPDP
jgi:small ligand-binding sensory domain FIST